MFGTAVTTVVLPLIVYEATGSAAQTGLLFALRVVPYLLFGLVAGPIADRGNRRLLIVGGNLVEGALVATIPIAHVLGVLTVAQVYVVALLSATAFVFSDAAVFGAVPALVGADRVAAANGLLASFGSAAELGGPVLAGVLVATIGPAPAVAVDALSFFVAAAIQARIRSTFRDPSAVVPPTRRLREGVRDALRFIRNDPTMSTLLGAGFGNSFAFGAVLGLLVPYAVEELDLASDDGLIGVLYAAVAVGGFVCGVLFSRLFRRERIPILTPLTIAISGLVAVALATVSGWLAATALLVVFAFSVMLTIVTGITYRQLVAPDHLRSSVNVIGRMIGWGGQPFGAATGALIAATAGVPVAYFVAGVIMLVVSVVAWVMLRRTVTDAAPV